jgi:predicted permease
MALIIPTLSRLAFLFSFILLGYILTKLKAIPTSSDGVLSKLENNLFTPCLIIDTFISEFRVDSLLSSWKPVALCALVLIVTLPL